MDNSGNKQSVLVKRVVRDGVVVSGLENRGPADGDGPPFMNEAHEEDRGTLGSQGANTVNRESNIVNYETNEGSVSRLRSTMYITA